MPVVKNKTPNKQKTEELLNKSEVSSPFLPIHRLPPSGFNRLFILLVFFSVTKNVFTALLLPASFPPKPVKNGDCKGLQTSACFRSFPPPFSPIWIVIFLGSLLVHLVLLVLFFFLILSAPARTAQILLTSVHLVNPSM